MKKRFQIHIYPHFPGECAYRAVVLGHPYPRPRSHCVNFSARRLVQFNFKLGTSHFDAHILQICNSVAPSDFALCKEESAISFVITRYLSLALSNTLYRRLCVRHCYYHYYTTLFSSLCGAINHISCILTGLALVICLMQITYLNVLRSERFNFIVIVLSAEQHKCQLEIWWAQRKKVTRRRTKNKNKSKDLYSHLIFANELPKNHVEFYVCVSQSTKCVHDISFYGHIMIFHL